MNSPQGLNHNGRDTPECDRRSEHSMRVRPQSQKVDTMANILSRDKQISALHHLVEGNTIRSTERLTGVHRDTIMRLLVRFGGKCQELMDQRLRGLTLKHLEIDETWTYCVKKQGRLTVDEKVECYDQGDQYLWVAVDQDTKLIVSHLVGKRSADNARRLMRDLSQRLVMPSPHASDAHHYQSVGYKTICQISTDMLAAYPEAIDQFFGPYVKYGQIRKEYRNATLAYHPGEMVGTDRRGIVNIRDSEYGTICTSHVERWNLTNRVLMKRFTRLSLGFSKKLDNLKAAVSLFIAYYNFVWRTRRPGKSGRYRPTAAMMVGVTKRLWSFEDLYDAAISA